MPREEREGGRVESNAENRDEGERERNNTINTVYDKGMIKVLLCRYILA